MDLTQEIIQLLEDESCEIFGFADLRILQYEFYKGKTRLITGIVIGAPLECGTPISKSLCPPNCNTCADICPAEAIKEGLWEHGVHRDDFFDVELCNKGRPYYEM